MSKLGDKIAIVARGKIGSPYVWGTHGPNTFDCSGFVWWCVEQVDPRLPHSMSSYEYPKLGSAVTKSDLQPGDVLMFNTERNGRCGHVGVVLGQDSNGKWVMANALNENAGVVRSDPFSSYFAPIYLGARRLVPNEIDHQPAPSTETVIDRIEALENRVTALERRASKREVASSQVRDALGRFTRDEPSHT